MRRYEPCISFWDYWDSEGHLSMKESKDGEWTSYENARHAIKQKDKQIERLNKKIAKLKKLPKLP